jgi:hypothetical protein
MLKVTVFRDVTPCNLAETYYDSDEHVASIIRAVELKLEGTDSLETLLPIHQTAWSHIPGDSNLHIHRRENVKLHMSLVKLFVQFCATK